MPKNGHDMPPQDGDSLPPSFDFDEDAISALLDTFVETQTGPQQKRISHPADPSDAGAQAAQRTVFQHTPRYEALPLVGDTPAAKMRRIALLDALAERAVGSTRARLLTSAAELCEQLGDTESAAEAYGRALAADARDVVVLRALRRHAMHREEWDAVADALEKEASLELSADERASTLKLLALLHSTKLGDPASAEQAAAHAAGIHDDDFVAFLLLASARLARGDLTRAAEAIAAGAHCWPESAAEAVMTQHAAELMEQAGDLERAKALYERTLDLDRDSLSARLGLARAERALDASHAAIDALVEAAQGASPELARALRRNAAAAMNLDLDQYAEGVALLQGADDVASRWTLAEAAGRGGDIQSAIAAFEAPASNETTQSRAVSQARRARLLAELGRRPELEDAASQARNVEALEPYVRAWDRMSAPHDDGGELELLMEAMAQAPQSVAADVVRADNAAREGDGAAFFASLERERDRASSTTALGATLALAEVADETGVMSRKAILAHAHEETPTEPLIARALSLFESDDPQVCAERWTEEAAAVSGERAAFALMMAARLWPSGSAAANHARNAAIDEQPDYLPSLWELEDGSASAAARAKSAAAQAALDLNPAAGQLRASMWVETASESLAHAEAALDANAPDPLLLEHLFESVGRTSEAAGDLMELGARHLDPLPYLERAATSFLASGLPDRAAKALREALEQAPDDEALQVQCREAELQAGEFARVADWAMRWAREATEDAEQLRALSAMADVDRLARRDMQSGRLSFQSIAETRPDHVPTARVLEWDALRARDGERILSSVRRVLKTLAPEAPDRSARHRLMVEVLRSDPDILQSDVDRLLRGIDDPLDADAGLARQVLGAAYAKDDPDAILRALQAIQAHLDTDLEKGALALEAAHVLERRGEPQQALGILDAAKGHPLALEAEAHLLRAAKAWDEAAAMYQAAASRAKDGQRAASLRRAAGCIFEEELGDTASAIDAYVAATESDITYLDVYRRLASLYRREERFDDLAALTKSRIEAGADTPTLVQLLLEQATQRRERGDLDGVVASLRECLELDPHYHAALRELVETHRSQEDWQGAAEALIRIARLKRSTEEEVWAFSQIAEIYHEHLEDLPRAEASLRQVLKLAPAHIATLDRLASVLSLQGKGREAARVLEELVRRSGSDAQERDYRIRLAAAIEAMGQPRQAERTLEQLRHEQPTEVDVILALADHYDRQGATPAAAMHLNRAVADLRAAIDEHPEDEALWTTLVRVLNRRHGPGPASCVASAAVAMGHPASLFEGDVTIQAEALGEAHLPLSSVIDAVVAPRGLPQTARRLFVLCEHSFDKVLPFDAGAWRLRRPSGPQHVLVEEAGAVAEALGISEPRVRITPAAPHACMPISGDPPTLVVGNAFLERTTPQERVFLFARGLKIASNHLTAALRARPDELDSTLVALLGGHEASPARQPLPPDVQDLRRKLIRAVPRRWRDEVESLVLEIRGDADFSSLSVPYAVAELGNRVALCLTGDVPSAVDALLKIAGHELPDTNDGRLDAIRQTPEAWDLIRFAISDAHFEARTQAGVDP